MTVLISYLLETVACSTIFAAYYFIALRNRRFHSWNRFYILSAVVLSFLIPAMQITVYIESVQDELVIAGEMQDNLSAIRPETAGAEASSGFFFLMIALYSIVAILLIVREAVSLAKIIRIKHRSRLCIYKGIKLHYTDSEQAPCSLFKLILWPESIDPGSRNGQYMLNHERTHIRERHSLDKVFMHIVCSLAWFNPLLHLLRRELEMIHEFAADSKSIIDDNPSTLASLILCSLYPQHYSQLTNNFFHSPIKQRIIMINKKNNKESSALLKLPALLVVAITMLLFACKTEQKPKSENVPSQVQESADSQSAAVDQAKEEAFEEETVPINSSEPKAEEDNAVPFAVAAIKPKFQGREADAFIKWVQSQLVYPREAASNSIQGTVYLYFDIDLDGSLINVRILRTVNPLLDKEALRVVNLSPKWTPGQHGGKAVKVSYQVPIKFQLNTKDEPKLIIVPDDQPPASTDAKALSSTKSKDEAEIDAVPYMSIEIKPAFGGGDGSKFTEWINSQVNYPEEAKNKKVQGTVVASFVIEKDGSLTEVKITHGVDPALDNEVLRVLKLSPKWEPGRHKLHGNPVRVNYSVPVQFKLL